MNETEAIDARGLYCPVPILRTRARLRELPRGAVLEILSDDPATLVDMPAFCRSHGHEYLGADSDATGAHRIRIRKGEARRVG